MSPTAPAVKLIFPVHKLDSLQGWSTKAAIHHCKQSPTKLNIFCSSLELVTFLGPKLSYCFKQTVFCEDKILKMVTPQKTNKNKTSFSTSSSPTQASLIDNSEMVRFC